jgi:hypothetical protein
VVLRLSLEARSRAAGVSSRGLRRGIVRTGGVGDECPTERYFGGG